MVSLWVGPNTVPAISTKWNRNWLFTYTLNKVMWIAVHTTSIRPSVLKKIQTSESFWNWQETAGDAWASDFPTHKLAYLYLTLPRIKITPEISRSSCTVGSSCLILAQTEGANKYYLNSPMPNSVKICSAVLEFSHTYRRTVWFL
jgi:hypothetical protein